MKKIFKKLLLLSVLFTLTLSAEDNRTIDIEKQRNALHEILENGWNESNKTLNTRIINLNKKFMPKMLELAQSPLEFIPPTTKEPYPIPEIRLTRDDDILCLVYLKYLEHSGKQEEAYQNYLTVLKGLKKLGHYDDHDFIILVFRIVIENITVQALQAGIKHHAFDEAHKKKLQKLLPDLLLLDNKMLLDSILAEKNDNITLLNDSTEKNNDSILVNQAMKEIYYYASIELELRYRKEYYAIQTNTLQILIAEKEKATLTNLCMENTIHAALNMMLFQSSTNYWKKCIGKVLFKVSKGKYSNLYSDYLEQVKANKAFIKSLSGSVNNSVSIR